MVKKYSMVKVIESADSHTHNERGDMENPHGKHCRNVGFNFPEFFIPIHPLNCKVCFNGMYIAASTQWWMNHNHNMIALYFCGKLRRSPKAVSIFCDQCLASSNLVQNQGYHVTSYPPRNPCRFATMQIRSPIQQKHSLILHEELLWRGLTVVELLPMHLNTEVC